MVLWINIVAVSLAGPTVISALKAESWLAALGWSLLLCANAAGVASGVRDMVRRP